jgi:hypothetical protein
MQQPIPWTQKEITLLHENGSNLILKEISQLLPRHTPIAVAAMRRRLGISLSKECLSRQRQICIAQLDYSITLDDLDNVTYQVLVGSLLGDACVSINGCRKNFFFRESHCKEQKEYAAWKVEKLNLFKPKLWDCKYGVQFTTKQHPIFSLLRNKFYKEKTHTTKTIIPEDLISKLDFLGLMIWYLDDGHLNLTGYKKSISNNACVGRPVITAKGWDIDTLTSGIVSINTKLNLSFSIKQHKQKNDKTKIIYFGSDNRNKLFPLWLDLAKEHALPKHMYYKLGIKSFGL